MLSTVIKKRKYLEISDDFLDSFPFKGNYPHLTGRFFEPGVNEQVKTEVALRYIFEKQGYPPENITCSFEKKDGAFRISFNNVGLYETGPVSSLFKTICFYAKKSKFIELRGGEALEYKIKQQKLRRIVFCPHLLIRGGDLIEDVSQALDFLDHSFIDNNHDDAVTVNFAIKDQVLKMGFADLNGKVVKSYYNNSTDRFLLLTKEDRDMAEYLLGLNSNTKEERLMMHTRYIILFEGHPKFGHNKDNPLKKERKKSWRKLPGFEPGLRAKIIDALLDHLQGVQGGGE